MARAFICGCAAFALAPEEIAFLRESDPWGLILFKRNVQDREQLRALTDAFRATVGRDDAPVLIDQEGGRVQRMGPALWRTYPAAMTFDASLPPGKSEEAARLAARLIAHDLREVGITVDCAPVLDVAEAGTHAAIGSRSYSQDPVRVAALGRAFAEGLMAGGVVPVVKHIPGHGRARVDSHFELPTVPASRAELERDFAPFRALHDLPAAMTAHVVYSTLDPDRPATTSPRIVQDILRGELGFDGLILSDDVSMKALGGPFEDRTKAIFAAGLDIALHCNGVLAEARAVASATPELAGRSLERAQAALAVTAQADRLDLAEAERRFEATMAALAAA